MDKKQTDKKSSREIVQEINLDSKTQKTIRDLVQGIQSMQAQLNLVCNTVLNVKGLEGEYILTPDYKKLVRKNG